MTDIKTLVQHFMPYLAAEKNLSRAQRRILQTELTRKFQSDYGTPILPSPGQTLVVPQGDIKTAALFFDRVWAPPVNDIGIPKDIAAYGATEHEVWPILLFELGDTLTPEQKAELSARNPGPLKFYESSGMDIARTIANAFTQAHGVPAVPMFKSQNACDIEYKAGSSQSLLAAVEGIRVVDEARLTWEQVQEVRRDTAAKARLRRMRHWLDTEMVGKPMSYVSDEIGIRVDDYENSLKKHGIETFWGAMSDLLDEKFVMGISGAVAGASVAGGGMWGAIAGAGLAIGRVTISLRTRLIELRDRASGQGAEVAFVHELKKLAPKK
jgi:hypothetical protein